MDKNVTTENYFTLYCELLKEKFYFGIAENKPVGIVSVSYFSSDEEFTYKSFYLDFGPLNLGMVYKYCYKVNQKLKNCILTGRRLVHYTISNDLRIITNAAFLAGAYAIIFLKFTAEQAIDVLTQNNTLTYVPFRDVAYGPSTFDLTLLDCFRGLIKARKCGFFSMETFNVREYDHYEKVENGDMNWIIPKKFLAFSGPVSKSYAEGLTFLAPESYIPYFQRNNITSIIRLNKKLYDETKFRNAGFKHYDLFFVDGSTPSPQIVQNFLEISEKTKGAIAVHCKAGLGRTGTLIGCYLMKHYHFTALEAIAWMRIVRPGSVIGHQQHFLAEKQMAMWSNNVVAASDSTSDTSFNNQMQNYIQEPPAGYTQGDILKQQKMNAERKDQKQHSFSQRRESQQHLLPSQSQLPQPSVTTPRLLSWMPNRPTKKLIPTNIITNSPSFNNGSLPTKILPQSKSRIFNKQLLESQRNGSPNAIHNRNINGNFLTSLRPTNSNRVNGVGFVDSHPRNANDLNMRNITHRNNNNLIHSKNNSIKKFNEDGATKRCSLDVVANGHKLPNDLLNKVYNLVSGNTVVSHNYGYPAIVDKFPRIIRSNINVPIKTDGKNIRVFKEIADVDIENINGRSSVSLPELIESLTKKEVSSNSMHNDIKSSPHKINTKHMSKKNRTTNTNTINKTLINYSGAKGLNDKFSTVTNYGTDYTDACYSAALNIINKKDNSVGVNLPHIKERTLSPRSKNQSIPNRIKDMSYTLSNNNNSSSVKDNINIINLRRTLSNLSLKSIKKYISRAGLCLADWNDEGGVDSGDNENINNTCNATEKIYFDLIL